MNWQPRHTCAAWLPSAPDEVAAFRTEVYQLASERGLPRVDYGPNLWVAAGRYSWDWFTKWHDLSELSTVAAILELMFTPQAGHAPN